MVESWMQSREPIVSTINESDAVLCAWGLSRPSGPALGHFRLQVRWVGEVLAARGIESAYCFGDGPRHPSRWQRYTSRAHPDLSFEEAAVASLRLVQVPSLVNVIAAPMGRKKV